MDVKTISDAKRNELADEIVSTVSLAGCYDEDDIALQVDGLVWACRKVLGRDVVDAFDSDCVHLLAELVRR